MSIFDEALNAIEFNKSVVVNDAAIAEIIYWNQVSPYIETIRTALTQATEIERGDKVVVDGWKPIATLPVDAGHVKLWYEYKDRSGTGYYVDGFMYGGYLEANGF